MSVYGGDSWAREAHNRKRRVDEMMIEGVEPSSYKRLSNGKYACLVCSNNPVLDTPVMLYTHVNSARHRAAEFRCKDRNLYIQKEVSKRIAVSECYNPIKIPTERCKISNKPLIEQAQKAVYDVLDSQTTRAKGEHVSNISLEDRSSSVSSSSSKKVEVKGQGAVEEKGLIGYRERLEMELKFTAAGWKRDCYGKWFRDENVEFDSDDEEDPNIVLKDPDESI